LINANYAHTYYYNGTGQTICIIDTGVDYNHPDLGGCFGNGCKVKAGYDYVNTDSNPMDDEGHGTHVAGIVASNDSMYKGVAYGADIVALKAGNYNGGFSENAIRNSLQWCYNNRNTYDISVVSMSFGGPNGWGQCGEDFADEEINDLYNAGITLVAASGNDGNGNQISYPACNDQIISVGATYDGNVGPVTGCDFRFFIWCLWECTDDPTSTDMLACWSNRGPLLDLLAPGCNITSTKYGTSEHEVHCGTSMAAPMVSGAAALLLQKNSSLNSSDIMEILQDTGVDVESWKRIDIEAALDSFCVCDDWSVGSCGSGGCDSNQKPWTRSCHPSACDTESQCVYDASCEDPGGDVDECEESGYEYCIEYEWGNCDVSIAENLYTNTNDIEWGAVDDAWDPYVIGEYTIGWKDVDALDMYYDCDGDTDCDTDGCDCD